ncbi:MAG: GTP 3',8-cyclase MoaA [Anaerolineae bacterium]
MLAPVALHETTNGLHDRFGRHINYLRISVTDHCNLRCVYCMPTHGLTFAPNRELLTAEEIEIVVHAAVKNGFHKFRLTGGEPTVRPDIVDIVRRIARTPGVADLSMTTNGIRLTNLAEELKAAGLNRVNVHIDTLNAARLPALMRWGKLEKLWAGLEAAERAGLKPIKVNCVVTRGYNEDDVVDVARLAVERDWGIRFIELMPLGGGAEAQVAIDRFVPTSETKARIEAALGELTPLPNRDASDESRNYRLPNGRGSVGFISPVSEPYCDTCNRMRLTSDGKFHLCLLHDAEIDIKAALRSGGGPAEVEALLARAVSAKPTGHALRRGVYTEDRRMHQIGG